MGEMGEISGLFFLMNKPKSRKNVSMWRSHRPSCLERTIGGSGDRASPKPAPGKNTAYYSN